jgi:hypothetical protein
MKNLITALCYFLSLLPLLSPAQIKLEKQSLLDNKIELLVPVYFKPMEAEMLNYKYPNRNQQPQLVLTDKQAEVNIIVSIINQPLQANQIATFKDFQISGLKKTHPDAKWLDNGVRDINGKNVGYFKFISNAVDQPVYNYYFFTNINGKVLLLTFNCIEKLLPEWKDVAESIVTSLKFK